MNKIIHRCQLVLICTVVFLLFPAHIDAQDTILNKYGLWVINTTEELKKTCQHDAAKKMIDIKKAITGIVLDLRYAGKNNFMNEKLYPSITTTFLRKAAADALAHVQEELAQKGFGLKIFDAYRPYSVTERLWEPVKDDRYAADPKKGSGHNRGIAVDLTIINLQSKEELNMGTGFDNFSDTAHHAFKDLPALVLQNRLMLKTIMEKYGFKALDTEWWHYYLPNTSYFELLDISFKKLGKIKT
jgi:zinc D-Ala-D-Ala dipeptidase